MNLHDTITQRINEYLKQHCKDEYFVEVIGWSYEVDRGSGGCCCSSYGYTEDDYVSVQYSRGKTPKGNSRMVGRWSFYGTFDEFISLLDG